MKDTLFYDGNCPICLKEIKHLQVLADDALVFKNIRELALEAEEEDKLLSQLHVKTATGEMLTGFSANIRAWQHTKYRPFLGLWYYPPFKWLGDLGYAIWLKYYHYQRNKCSVSP